MTSEAPLLAYLQNWTKSLSFHDSVLIGQLTFGWFSWKSLRLNYPNNHALQLFEKKACKSYPCNKIVFDQTVQWLEPFCLKLKPWFRYICSALEVDFKNECMNNPNIKMVLQLLQVSVFNCTQDNFRKKSYSSTTYDGNVDSTENNFCDSRKVRQVDIWGNIPFFIWHIDTMCICYLY